MHLNREFPQNYLTSSKHIFQKIQLFEKYSTTISSSLLGLCSFSSETEQPTVASVSKRPSDGESQTPAKRRVFPGRGSNNPSSGGDGLIVTIISIHCMYLTVSFNEVNNYTHDQPRGQNRTVENMIKRGAITRWHFRTRARETCSPQHYCRQQSIGNCKWTKLKSQLWSEFRIYHRNVSYIMYMIYII